MKGLILLQISLTIVYIGVSLVRVCILYIYFFFGIFVSLYATCIII